MTWAGWDKGLSGTPNTSTAVAPKGAMSRGVAAISPKAPIRAMPISPPRPALITPARDKAG